MSRSPWRLSVALISLLSLMSIYCGNSSLIQPGYFNEPNISGTVWRDQNGNGVRDEGEPPLSGAKVRLWSYDSAAGEVVEVIKETDTYESGYFFFDATLDATYVLEFIGPEGLILTLKGDDSVPDPRTRLSDPIPLGSGSLDWSSSNAGFRPVTEADELALAEPGIDFEEGIEEVLPAEDKPAEAPATPTPFPPTATVQPTPTATPFPPTATPVAPTLTPTPAIEQSYYYDDTGDAVTCSNGAPIDDSEVDLKAIGVAPVDDYLWVNVWLEAPLESDYSFAVLLVFNPGEGDAAAFIWEVHDVITTTGKLDLRTGHTMTQTNGIELPVYHHQSEGRVEYFLHRDVLPDMLTSIGLQSFHSPEQTAAVRCDEAGLFYLPTDLWRQQE